VFLASNNEVVKTKWVMDPIASKHIYRDQEMFDTLKNDGEFIHFKLGNGGKMKVEGIWSVRMKLHDGATQTFSNVRFAPSAIVNMISIVEMTSQGTSILVQSGVAKCTRGDTRCCKDRKIKINFAIWMVKP